jgi:NADH:ubiquinone oxidoreductase subunit 4 (subunit M)
MGGVAFKAPVLATVFLIITLANLAMPGSSNFIGEFMILLGAFNAHIVIAVIASIAVVGAAVYALRLFITAMHNRVGSDVRSREIGPSEAVAIVPLVAKLAIAPAALAGGSVPYGLQGVQSTASVHWTYPPLSEVSYSPSKPKKAAHAQ